MMNFKNTHLTLDQIIPILNVITDAVFIDDADGVCQWCNDACEEMYNIEYDEIVGRHVEDLEKSGIFTPSVTRRVLEEKREITIIHENRFGRRLLTTGSPVFVPMTSGEWVAAGEGRYSRTIAFVLTTSRDITQISTVQEQPDTPGSALLKARNLDVPEDVGSSFIVSESEAMHNVMALTKKLASVNTTVLITGESGVGKGLIARRLHEEVVRWKKPFVTVNCGAIPENLI